jgi:hypothetical protein
MMHKKMIYHMKKARENAIYICVQEELDEMINLANGQHDVFADDEQEE